MADLQVCDQTTSAIRVTVKNCISEVSASTGDEDVRSLTTGLTGAGWERKASTAADEVSQARTTFANRMTNHSSGIYNAPTSSKPPTVPPPEPHQE